MNKYKVLDVIMDMEDEMTTSEDLQVKRSLAHTISALLRYLETDGFSSPKAQEWSTYEPVRTVKAKVKKGEGQDD